MPLPLPAAAPPLWAYQARFYKAMRALATDLFNTLDDELDPQVLLLALPLHAGQPVRWLEPAPDGLPTAPFADALARGQAIEAVSTWPHSERFDVSPAMTRRKHQGLGIRMAVQHTLTALDQGTAYQHLANWPVELSGYFVLTVLRLRRKPLQAYPALRPDRYYTDGRPLPASLLLAAAQRFLDEGVKALSEPEPGAGIIFRARDTEELLRAAGRSFLDTPAQALGLDPATTKLFATCNTISSLRYEGAEGVGQLLLARRGHPNLTEVFALTCPTELTDYRAVRKLLEMTTPDVHLLADGEHVYALGRLSGPYDPVREDLFIISFTTHFAWELQHAGQVLLRAHYGVPGLPRNRLSRTRFRHDLRRTFGLTESAGIGLLWDIVLAASRQSHGTLLVITTEALAEADRLKLQCTLIEPVLLTPLITSLVTSIDGAVLLDPAGYCYSIGVILDGRASGRGDSTRGARYNSALRYVESSEYPCLAVVVSEDGLVDVITSTMLGAEKK